MTRTNGGSVGADVRPRKLGRGLSSLLGEAVRVVVGGEEEPRETTEVSGGVTTPAMEAAPAVEESGQGGTRIEMVAVGALSPSRWQPRRQFDGEALGRLAESIKAAGVMQPVLARRVVASDTHNVSHATFEIVAGERRWRAAGLAGLGEVPTVIVELTDEQAAEWALVENLQREDLTAMEKAVAFKRLVAEFRLRQEDVAQRVGIDRASVSNHLRLLELETEVQELVDRGTLTFGHARALLGAMPGQWRIELAKKAASEGWSVRAIEEASGRSGAGVAAKFSKAARGRILQDAADTLDMGPADLAIKDLEKQLSEKWGTKVKIRSRRQGKRGRITIEFYSLDHFDGLMEKMGVRLAG